MSHAQPTQPERGATAAILSNLARLHRFVVACDGGGKVTWASDAATELVGTDVVGRACLDVLPDVSNPHEVPGAGLRGATLHTDTGPREVDVAILSLPLASRTDALSVAILRPTENREYADAARRPSVDYLAAILDSAPDAVVALDRCGFVTYANPALERITGRSPDEIRDRPAAALLSATTDFCSVAANLKPNGELKGDLELRGSDGSTSWISVSSRALRLPDGRAAGSVSFLRDVTERKSMQAKLEHKNTELESYVHSVSHDLRSPLVSLLGFSRLLRQDHEATLDDTGRHFLDRIEQAGRTMEGLIQDLLELSKIGESGETRTLVDPRSVLLQLQAEIKPRLDEQNIDLRLPSDPPLVFCDRTRLYQVFSNLIGNAVDHMGPCQEPSISVDIETRSGHHDICVRDNGAGIDANDHERIFQVFRSLRRRNGGPRSTGMGLAIVKKIAETHDGRVWVDSHAGEGAAFHVTLSRS